MKTAVRSKLILAAVFIFLAIVFIVFVISRFTDPEANTDPHEGQVHIYDGWDWVW